MSTLRKGLSIAVGTLTVTLFIVVAITLVSGGSVLAALSEPTLWVVEVSSAALAPVAVLTRPSGEGAWRVVTAQAGWAVVAALLIGALVALTIGAPVLELLSSAKFVIPAGIAVLVAAAEAWPADGSQGD